jgi:hypothetical protein
MELAVVDPKDRNDKFVANSVSKRTRLGKGQVVRVRRHTAADKARLPKYKFAVVFVAEAKDHHCAVRRILRSRRPRSTEVPVDSDRLDDDVGVTPRMILVLRKLARIREAARRPAPLPRRSKVGRNHPCPCGSGKKYKRCCACG